MSAEEFLRAVGHDLRRSEAQMQGIIEKVVHENWFETVDDLRRGVSNEEFAELKLPKNFVLRLKELARVDLKHRLCARHVRVVTKYLESNI